MGEIINQHKPLPRLSDEKETCCGCSACYATCPVSAISMRQDKKGFPYPMVNAELCIRCYQCEKVCAFKKE